MTFHSHFWYDTNYKLFENNNFNKMQREAWGIGGEIMWKSLGTTGLSVNKSFLSCIWVPWELYNILYLCRCLTTTLPGPTFFLCLPIFPASLLKKFNPRCAGPHAKSCSGSQFDDPNVTANPLVSTVCLSVCTCMHWEQLLHRNTVFNVVLSLCYT
jgi:hypothetical protein